MRKSNYPILITNVVHPYALDHNALLDPNVRLKLSREAIFRLLEKKVFDKVVIVDGSNTDILAENEIQELEAMGFSIEQLSFQQNIDDVTRYGKSNGEMQITNHAVNHSELIKENGGFYKISGRYGVKNIENILKFLEGYKSFFFRYNPIFFPIKMHFVCTIFYKCSLNYYRSHIEEAIIECSTNKKGFLESVFYRKTENLRTVNLFLFPFFSGIGGTYGKEISNPYFILRQLFSLFGFLILVEE